MDYTKTGVTGDEPDLVLAPDHFIHRKSDGFPLTVYRSEPDGGPVVVIPEEWFVKYIAPLEGGLE